MIFVLVKSLVKRIKKKKRERERYKKKKYIFIYIYSGRFVLMPFNRRAIFFRRDEFLLVVYFTSYQRCDKRDECFYI